MVWGSFKGVLGRFIDSHEFHRGLRLGASEVFQAIPMRFERFQKDFGGFTGLQLSLTRAAGGFQRHFREFQGLPRHVQIPQSVSKCFREIQVVSEMFHRLSCELRATSEGFQKCFKAIMDISRRFRVSQEVSKGFYGVSPVCRGASYGFQRDSRRVLWHFRRFQRSFRGFHRFTCELHGSYKSV